VAKFFEGDALRNSFFAIVEDSRELGFGDAGYSFM
jgi:hypothetical protein